MTHERISRKALNQLRRDHYGPVLVDSDEGYDQARRVYNGYYDRRPTLIARCRGASDVQVALRFARAHELTIAVRGGGHSNSGASTIDDGILIDLSLMRGVCVDVKKKSAIALAGSLLAELDRETAAHGLAVTAGTVSHTGIAGLTLYGGVGRLMRKHGLTCDNVLAFDIVTADGEHKHVDTTSYPDLFWALRGGGATFGIVTHFHYRLHDQDPIVHGGYLGWPLHQAKDVYTALHSIAASAPDDFQMQYIFCVAPDVEFIPESLRGRPCLLMTVTWLGDRQEGERFLRPFRERVPPTLNMVGDFPYTTLQAASDPLAQHGRWNVAGRPGYLNAIPEALFDTAIEAAQRFPVTWNFIEFSLMGGEVSRKPEDFNAATLFRGANWFYIVGGDVMNEEERLRLRRWTTQVDASFRPFAREGRYINFFADGDEQDLRKAIGAATYDRLVAIKAKYDPENLFSHNPNRRPSAPRYERQTRELSEVDAAS